MFPLETAQTIAIVLLVVGAFLAEYLLSGKNSFQLIKIPILNLFAKLFTAGFGVFAPLAIGVGFGLAPSEFNFAFWCIGSGAGSAVVAVFLWDEIQKLATIWKVATHTMAITIILCFAWEADGWVVRKAQQSASESITQAAADSKAAGMRNSGSSANNPEAQSKTPRQHTALYSPPVQQQLPVSERPYVIAEDVQFIEDEQKVRIQYHNSGRTLAVNLGLTARYAIADSHFDLNTVKPENLTQPSGFGSVSADMRIANDLGTHKTDHPNEFKMMKDGQLRGYVFGFLRYKDLDGRTYEPRFCFIWSPQDKAFERCPANKFTAGQKL